MLYFSKLRIFSVIILSLIFIIFALSNFIFNNNSFFKKKINLGLDLQGGSYLLLEVDNRPVITQQLQSKVIEIKKHFKEKGIIIKNIKLEDKTIKFQTKIEFVEKINNEITSKENIINPYFSQYKSFQFDIINEEENFSLTLSKYGVVLIKNSSLDQAIEIVIEGKPEDICKNKHSYTAKYLKSMLSEKFKKIA